MKCSMMKELIGFSDGCFLTSTAAASTSKIWIIPASIESWFWKITLVNSTSCGAGWGAALATSDDFCASSCLLTARELKIFLKEACARALKTSLVYAIAGDG